jgi:hypothetical protein
VHLTGEYGFIKERMAVPTFQPDPARIFYPHLLLKLPDWVGVEKPRPVFFIPQPRFILLFFPQITNTLKSEF